MKNSTYMWLVWLGIRAGLLNFTKCNDNSSTVPDQPSPSFTSFYNINNPMPRNNENYSRFFHWQRLALSSSLPHLHMPTRDDSAFITWFLISQTLFGTCVFSLPHLLTQCSFVFAVQPSFSVIFATANSLRLQREIYILCINIVRMTNIT